jgi:protein required for attachment to host cells
MVTDTEKILLLREDREKQFKQKMLKNIKKAIGTKITFSELGDVVHRDYHNTTTAFKFTNKFKNERANAIYKIIFGE